MRFTSHSDAQRSARNALPLADRYSRFANRSAFTVIELVMVCGVLTVLLAIILPTIKTAHAAALRKKAQAEATALAQAAICYKIEYGFWPGQLEVKNAADGTVQLRDAFKSAFQSDNWIYGIISRYGNISFEVTATGTAPVYMDENWAYQAFRRVGEKTGTAFQPNPLNPKGIHFLDLANEEAADQVNFPDPWGRQYILIMGLNPHTVFTHTVTAQGSSVPSHSVSVSNTIAFAFSYGPAGNLSTNYIYSAGVQ